MNDGTDIDPEVSRQRKLRMRSWRRGTKEMDLILGPFADSSLGSMKAPTLNLYEKLLSENDQDLYMWVNHSDAAPQTYSTLLNQIRQFHDL